MFRQRFRYIPRRKALGPAVAAGGSPALAALLMMDVERRNLFHVFEFRWQIGQSIGSLLRSIPFPIEGELYRIVHESEDTLTGFTFEIIDENGVDILDSQGTGSSSFPRSIWPKADGNVPLRLQYPGNLLHIRITTTNTGEAGNTFLYIR